MDPIRYDTSKPTSELTDDIKALARLGFVNELYELLESLTKLKKIGSKKAEAYLDYHCTWLKTPRVKAFVINNPTHPILNFKYFTWNKDPFLFQESAELGDVAKTKALLNTLGIGVTELINFYDKRLYIDESFLDSPLKMLLALGAEPEALIKLLQDKLNKSMHEAMIAIAKHQ